MKINVKMPHNSPCYQCLGSRLSSTLNRSGGGGLGEVVVIYTFHHSCPYLSFCSPKISITEIKNKNNLKVDTAVKSGKRDIPETHC